MYMTLPDISIPDIQQKDIDQCRTAAGNVLHYAKHCIATLSQPVEIPAWYTPVQINISNTQLHAKMWMNNTGPSVDSSILRPVIDFNLTFQLLSNIIQNTVNEIAAQGNMPSTSQRRYIDGLLNDLINAIVKQQQSVTLLRQQVNAYAVLLNESYSNLSADLETATAKFADAQFIIDKVRTVTGNALLSDTILLPANKTNADPALFNIVYVNAISENIITGVQSAQRSIQAIVDAWTILFKKFTAIIADLDDAADDEYAGNLQQLDMETARIQWQALSDYASALIKA